jgi:hypothetical protein
MTYLMSEFFQPDNKHPFAWRVLTRRCRNSLAPSVARRAASLPSKEKSVTQRAKSFITRSERDCQTARDSPLDRDGLEDIPQATLEPMELGDHRK